MPILIEAGMSVINDLGIVLYDIVEIAVGRGIRTKKFLQCDKNILRRIGFAKEAAHSGKLIFRRSF